MRLSARGPAAAPGVPRRLRARARGAGRGGAAHDAVLVGFPGARRPASATTRSPCCATAASPHVYRKQCLPNYTVFDEERYFAPGDAPCVFDVDGVALRPHHLRGRAGFPGRRGRRGRPARRCSSWPTARRTTRGSRRCGASRSARARAKPAADRLRQPGRRPGRARVRRRVVRRRRGRRGRAAAARVARDGGDRRRSTTACRSRCAARSTRALEPHVYAALVMGVRDYVGKNGFPGVLLGLVRRRRFGADAGGRGRRARARRVRAVMLPSPYNAPISLDDARDDGGHRRRALRRDPDRAGVRRVSRRRWPASSRGLAGGRRPRRTSRRASAARC